MITEQKLLKFVKKIIPIINKKAASNNLLKFKSKKDFQIDPVTKFDVAMEKIIRGLIKSEFRNCNIIGEELRNENNNSDFTWVIDPIDGTKSLILNLPNWSNLIGLYFKEKCIFSFANFPILKKTYVGIGNQTLLITKKKTFQIKSDKKITTKNMKLAINTLHSLRDRSVKNFILNFKGFFKVTGSDAYNFCSIAEGKLDALIESGLKQVDILPIIKIVENSGAIITNWKGLKDFKEGRVLVSSNNIIHKYLIKKINSKR